MFLDSQAMAQERRKRARLMRTASRLTQSELVEVMALQVRRDEQRLAAEPWPGGDDVNEPGEAE